MAEPALTPPQLGEATQHAHECLQRALLAQGGRYQIPNPYPDGWRVGPLALDSGQGPDSRLWFLVPWDVGQSEPPLESCRRIVASLDAEVRARVTVALTVSELPPEPLLDAVERSLDAEVVACTNHEGAAGPRAEAGGSGAALRALLQVENAALASVDPAKDWARLGEAVAGAGFFQRLRQATPSLRVTPALIAACVGVWLVQVISGVSPSNPDPLELQRWGANAAMVTLLQDQPWRLLATGFLHGGWLHLGVNMWVLKDLGALCERLFGPLAYLAVFLVAVVGGSLASLVWHPEIAAAIGASGGIFGLGGAILGFMAAQRGSVPPSLVKRLGRSLGLFVLLNLALGAGLNQTNLVSVDNSAHIGGLLSGTLAGFLLARPIPPTAARRHLAWIPALALALGGVYVGLAHWPALHARAEEGRDRIELVRAVREIDGPLRDRYNAALKSSADVSGVLDDLNRLHDRVQGLHLESAPAARLQRALLRLIDARHSLASLFPDATPEAWQAARAEHAAAQDEVISAWEEFR